MQPNSRMISARPSQPFGLATRKNLPSSEGLAPIPDPVERFSSQAHLNTKKGAVYGLLGSLPFIGVASNAVSTSGIESSVVPVGMGLNLVGSLTLVGGLLRNSGLQVCFATGLLGLSGILGAYGAATQRF